MASRGMRMSWTRRILVLLAFVLMIGGVTLMVVQQEEWYLAVSVAGFALVLAAVPSLPRQRQAPPGSPCSSGEEAATSVGAREWTGNVTVLARPVEEGDAEAGSERVDSGPAEPDSERAEPSEAPEPEAYGSEPPELNASTHPAAASAGSPNGGSTGPAAATPAVPPSAAGSSTSAPRPTMSASRQPPLAHPHRPDVSPRHVAVAASAAGALVWAWRKLRR